MGRAHASHVPVMVAEVLCALRPRADGVYVDATYGRGGHARALLERLGPDARVLAMDRDPEAIAVARVHAAEDPRLRVEHAGFAALAEVARRHGVDGRADGLLLDLGVSAPQLEDPARGFSFLHDGPLDMRMDPGAGPSAAQWLARARAEEIADVIRRFGEERYARRIARAIVAARGVEPIERTGQLARIVERCVPRPRRDDGARRHPATRTFQALRIAVNREVEQLGAALAQSLDVLAIGGRLVAISFHSLEDRMVKRFIRDHARDGAPGPDGRPRGARLAKVAGPLRPSAQEVAANPRARSAVLRAAERVA